MFKKLKNNRGSLAVVLLSSVFLIIGVQFGKTVSDGTAKKNGKAIWAQMKGGSPSMSKEASFDEVDLN